MKKKIELIAEIGVNHNGSFALAKKMILKAKEVGADIVKFQTFFADKFVKKETLKVKYQKLRTNRNESHFDMIKKLELSENIFFKIKKFCEKKNIEFLSTPYHEESVNLLEKLKVKRYKVASADLSDLNLHERIIKTGKPVILSVGMSTISEIRKTLEFYKKKKHEKITLMHCVSNYPCSKKSLNLKVIETLKKEFNFPVGFSDHYTNNDAAIIATSLGATIIEKHFTLSKKLKGPDHLASYEPNEFLTYVKKIRDTEIILGETKKKIQNEEKEMLRISRKSITLKNSMKKGQIIKKEDITMKRPGIKLSGYFIKYILGKKIKKNLPKNYQIKLSDLI